TQFLDGCPPEYWRNWISDKATQLEGAHIKDNKSLVSDFLSQRLGPAEPSAAETAETPPAPQPTLNVGQEWEYYLKDGRGPYSDVQAAMDALGLPMDKRPKHQRWDRLSTQLKEQIQRRPKVFY
ncbi:unnamed protein product, partial [marine sediment metagenome]